MSTASLVDENDCNDIKLKQQMKYRAMFEYVLSKPQYEIKSKLSAKRHSKTNTITKYPAFIEWNPINLIERRKIPSTADSNPKRIKIGN